MNIFNKKDTKIDNHATYHQIRTDPSYVDLMDDYVEWNGRYVTAEAFNDKLETMVNNPNTIDINAHRIRGDFNKVSDSLTGIFGMPYQFSTIVDPIMDESKIGRKFNEKIFSLMPVLFLTPGEPKFMDGYGKGAKEQALTRLMGGIFDGDDDNGFDVDDGKYYSFMSNFPEYKKYANVALRALALFMGIGDVDIPVPGQTGNIKLSNIDVEDFMNNSFTKLFGTQCVVPFFVDAETSIQESYSNSTTESMIAQTVNGFSQTAKEVQFIMGSRDESQIVKNIGNATMDLGQSVTDALAGLGEVVAGKNMLSRVANELSTIVTGGKIIFPEIWSDSEYDKNYSVSLKLRSPDPDPVSIFLNIYMPLILLITMASPRQIGNSSNAYESPFLVRGTYKSFFSLDLGIISSLSITYGGQAQFNIMGQPITADVSLELKDLYHSMFISKRMGLISNTAQMDFLATLAGIDLNEYAPTRMIKLWAQILGDTPRDWAEDFWGGVKRTLNQKTSEFMRVFGVDTRFYM